MAFNPVLRALNRGSKSRAIGLRGKKVVVPVTLTVSVESCLCSKIILANLLSTAQFIAKPTVIPAAGRPPKIIEEFVGRVNSQTSAVSIAKTTTSSDWREPAQTPEFDEYTVVLRGELQIETRGAVHDVAAGQAIIVHAGKWLRYGTPGADGAK